MDAPSQAVAAPTLALAQWHADVRRRALARRAPEPARPPLPVWTGVAVAAVLFVWLCHALAPKKPTVPDEVSLQIVLRDEIPSAPEPPAPEPPLPQPPLRRAPAHPAAASRIAPATPASDAAAAPDDTPDAAADAADTVAQPGVPHVFNPDGSIDLPREPAPRTDALVATFSAPPRSAAALRIMTHQRPLKVRPNHFAANFRAPSGSALTDFVEDHLTVRKEFTLPWGTHVECKGVGLGLAWLGACGWYTPYKYYVPQAPWRPASVLDEQ